MKILTILGTRPEIIRLSEVIRILDREAEHVLVHTGQNYDARLSDHVLSGTRTCGSPTSSMGVAAIRLRRADGQHSRRRPRRCCSSIGRIGC